MTAPDILDTFFSALPAVEIHWRPLPDDRATVIDCGTGEWIVIHGYYGPREPRAMICPKHGAQRHDYNDRTGEFECKKCK